MSVMTQCSLLQTTIYIHHRLEELASQAQQPRRSTSATETALSFHVHLECHLGRRVDSGLLVAALEEDISANIVTLST